MNTFEHCHLQESFHRSLSKINPSFSLHRIDSTSIELLMILPNLLKMPQYWQEVLTLMFDLFYDQETVVRCDALLLLLNLLCVHYEHPTAKTLENEDNQSIVFLQVECEVILFSSDNDGDQILTVVQREERFVKTENPSDMNLLYIVKHGG